jgi:hypothetical protein
VGRQLVLAGASRSASPMPGDQVAISAPSM